MLLAWWGLSPFRFLVASLRRQCEKAFLRILLKPRFSLKINFLLRCRKLPRMGCRARFIWVSVLLVKFRVDDLSIGVNAFKFVVRFMIRRLTVKRLTRVTVNIRLVFRTLSVQRRRLILRKWGQVVLKPKVVLKF